MSIMVEASKYMTLDQAAEALQLSVRTVRLYIARGQLTGYRKGTGRGAQYVLRSEVEALQAIVPIDAGDQAEE